MATKKPSKKPKTKALVKRELVPELAALGALGHVIAMAVTPERTEPAVMHLYGTPNGPKIERARIPYATVAILPDPRLHGAAPRGIVVPAENHVFVGISVCSPGDQFRKDNGAARAVRRCNELRTWELARGNPVGFSVDIPVPPDNTLAACLPVSLVTGLLTVLMGDPPRNVRQMGKYARRLIRLVRPDQQPVAVAHEATSVKGFMEIPPGLSQEEITNALDGIKNFMRGLR